MSIAHWCLRVGFLASALGVGPSALAQLACLPINDVEVVNAPSLDRAQIDAITAPFEGRCIGLGDFNAILEAVTDAYIAAGLITSRAYLPEQDLSDGRLEIAVVEGSIEKIRFNGAVDRSWQTVVYPGLVGRLANIREIEQGLDTIRAMESFSADMTLDPGSEIGTSILDINATSEKPWRATYSANNYSQDPMGEWPATVGLEADHALGINDQWVVNYTKSMSPSPFHFGYDGFGTEALNASLTIPYGKWEGTLAYSGSRYHQEIDGIFTPIPLNGWSQNWTFDLKRLVHRDRVSKTYLTLSLDRQENENYIFDTLIESSSRVLSTAKLDLSHERPFWDGTLKGNISYQTGLRWLGAEDYRSQPAGQPNAQFSRWNIAASYEKDWALRAGNLGYLSTFSSQLSDDRLYGGQQFAIGGPSTVRGVLSAVAAGSSGFLTRHEFEWQPTKFENKYTGKFGVYAGLDYGVIVEQTDIDVPYWQATGGVVGLRFEGGLFDLDVGYAHLLHLPNQSRLDEYQPSGEWMISLSREF